MVALGRAEDFSGKEETRGKFKNVLVSFCRIGRISQANRVDRIAEDFHYFPVLSYKHDGLRSEATTHIFSSRSNAIPVAPSR